MPEYVNGPFAPSYEPYATPPDYTSPEGRQYDTVREDGTVPTPVGSPAGGGDSWTEEVDQTWDGLCNQEKFRLLAKHLNELQINFNSLESSFRQHAHAPSGKVMVEYN